MSTQETQVAIIGAGPIGLELAVGLKKSGIDYLQFDARQIGYTISWFPPQTQFFSSNDRIAIAGIPLMTPNQAKATREQYLAYLRGVVEQFDLKVNTYEPIVGIEREQNGFILTSKLGVYRAKKLILCTGGTDHPRLLNIPGENLPHVTHYFDEPHKYFRKNILIVGGKNSAVESALRCHNAGANVSISYRRDALPDKSIKYWLLPEINHLIKIGRIKAYFNTVATEITSTSVKLAPSSPSPGTPGEGRGRGSSQSQIKNQKSQIHTPHPNPPPEYQGRGQEGESFDIPADFVLLLIGYQQDTTLLKLAGVELSGPCNAPVFDERTMETNVPNLYVAGTAVGGTQEKYTVFIENCHVHVERIIAALTGHKPPAAPTPLEQPES